MTGLQPATALGYPLSFSLLATAAAAQQQKPFPAASTVIVTSRPSTAQRSAVGSLLALNYRPNLYGPYQKGKERERETERKRMMEWNNPPKPKVSRVE